MTSKFGGIPVNGTDSLPASRFGGVEQPPQRIGDEISTLTGQPIEPTDLDEPGILDYIMGTGELAATMATGVIAEPVSGIAGIAKTITSGPEAGAETVKQVQEGMTYQPRTRGGAVVGQAVGETLAPVVGLAGKVSEGVGDIGYDIAGPFGGAAAKTMLGAIPEILGLKGTRLAKKMALGKMLKGKNIGALYDKLGNLMPEIRTGLKRSGIELDELKDVLPENILESGMVESAGEIGTAATTRVRPGKKAADIAEDVKPSKEIIEAAEELGVADQMLASHSSQNPTFVAVEQGLKSIPGSQLAAREKGLIGDLSKKADELIVEFGGEIDKSSLSDRFRDSSKSVINDLEMKADEAYTAVGAKIPKGLKVSANNTIGLINEMATDLGGAKYLGTKEAGLLKNLGPKTKPTYARLDKYRKQIGKALKDNSGPFRDADEGALKQLYKSLRKDQQLVAEGQGIGDLYNTASQLIVSRKTIEKQLVKVIGKDLAGSVTAKGRPAMLGLQNGNTKQFDDLMDNIPTEVGPEIKKSIVVSSLNDAFVQGSRAERSLNIPGFDDFMVGLNRHKGSKKRLTDAIGPEAMKRLDLMHTVIGGIREARKSGITTGRIAAVPGMFDEADNLASRLYGTAKKVAAAEGIGTVVGVPGAGTAGVIGSVLSAKRTKRSIAADEFLASPRFRGLLKAKAKGNLDTAVKLKDAERMLEKIKEYKRWKDSLDDKSLKDLAVVGAMGYLTGETIGKDSNKTQTPQLPTLKGI